MKKVNSIQLCGVLLVKTMVKPRALVFDMCLLVGFNNGVVVPLVFVFPLAGNFGLLELLQVHAGSNCCGRVMEVISVI